VLSIMSISLFSQPMNRRWRSRSIAMPDAASPGAMGHVADTVWLAVSMTLIALRSSMFT
jgi:hypothetical protein